MKFDYTNPNCQKKLNISLLLRFYKKKKISDIIWCKRFCFFGWKMLRTSKASYTKYLPLVFFFLIFLEYDSHISKVFTTLRPILISYQEEYTEIIKHRRHVIHFMDWRNLHLDLEKYTCMLAHRALQFLLAVCLKKKRAEKNSD
jgi:hypothetical protein